MTALAYIRPASHTSAGISASTSPTETTCSHTGTPPIASRIGINVGANTGMTDSISASVLSGWDGSTEMPNTYPTMTNINAGVITPPTSSCRDTNAARAAKTSEYMMNPSRYQTTSHTTVPTAADTDIDNTSNPSAKATPTPPITTICTNPTNPMPSTLPAISCHGRMVDSSSSTTRLDFSSTTPWATICPFNINDM